MAKLLCTLLALLSCVRVGSLSATASTAEDEEAPQHHTAQHHEQHQKQHQKQHEKHHQPHQQPHYLMAEEEHLAIGAKGGLMRSEASDDAINEDDTKHKSWATTPTPRPAMLLSEPHVSCGKHDATECSACVVSNGPDWCHGDCRWDADSDTCKLNVEVTLQSTTTDKYPGGDSEDAATDDAIASKLRLEQERSEQQEKDDRQKFWATVGISAGVSSCVIMCCGVVAIFFCFSSGSKPKKLEEALVEGEEAEAEGEEAEEDTAEPVPAAGYAP